MTIVKSKNHNAELEYMRDCILPRLYLTLLENRRYTYIDGAADVLNNPESLKSDSHNDFITFVSYEYMIYKSLDVANISQDEFDLILKTIKLIDVHVTKKFR